VLRAGGAVCAELTGERSDLLAERPRFNGNEVARAALESAGFPVLLAVVERIAQAEPNGDATLWMRKIARDALKKLPQNQAEPEFYDDGQRIMPGDKRD